jgi:hypothetical protein
LRAYVEEDGAEKPKRQFWQPEEEVFEYADESRDQQRKFSR